MESRIPLPRSIRNELRKSCFPTVCCCDLQWRSAVDPSYLHRSLLRTMNYSKLSRSFEETAWRTCPPPTIDRFIALNRDIGIGSVWIKGIDSREGIKLDYGSNLYESPFVRRKKKISSCVNHRSSKIPRWFFRALFFDLYESSLVRYSISYLVFKTRKKRDEAALSSMDSKLW